ncbi:MAG: DUF4876 domain-containing protein [Capnocytophaga felis]|nr:DUF4876 domain-containing protein [Capnocytophaga felis]
MKFVKHFFMVITALAIFNACKKDDSAGGAEKVNVKFNFEKPKGIEITKLDNVVVNLTELNTKTKKQMVLGDDYQLNLNIEQGSYEVSVDGKIQYKLDGNLFEGGVTAFINKIDLLKSTTQNIQLVLKSFSKDFIIEEVFFAGTLTPEGKQYFGDQYIKIYNNTNEVLYADGLLIADSRFLTTLKNEVTPNLMAEAFTTEGIVRIPGDGTKYPVKPGESIIVADQGINHKENNSNSLNLSGADFEIFYTGMKDGVDNPQVENAINFNGRMIFHNRGFRSYVLARLPKDVTAEAYLADYKYKYEYPIGDRIMKREAYKIPNNWIVDAVNLSVAAQFQWIVTDTSLDSGWTHCGKVDRDPARYGKAVRRKVIQEVDGKRLLKDTNNSTVDFEAEVVPSMMK